MSTAVRLTKRLVDGMKPGDTLHDAEVKGFAVRCQRRSRVYLLRVRLNGRQRWITIGQHGAPWTVETAREEAQRTLLSVVAVSLLGVFLILLADFRSFRMTALVMTSLPLALIGDGHTSQFQDRPRGFVSVHGRGSVLALGEALGREVDERRFRSNIAVEGLAPWDELQWAGRVRIGAAEFVVSHQIVRCLATHANPETGERDAPVMTTLTRTFGQEQPTLGTLLLPAGGTAEAGAAIHLGDQVEVLD